MYVAYGGSSRKRGVAIRSRIKLPSISSHCDQYSHFGKWPKTPTVNQTYPICESDACRLSVRFAPRLSASESYTEEEAGTTPKEKNSDCITMPVAGPFVNRRRVHVEVDW